MKPITVIGTGNSGFAMAVHLKSFGHCVYLWNRLGSDVFHDIQSGGGIISQGVIKGRFMPDLMTNDISEAIDDVGLILVTVPANAHASVVKEMAPHLKDDQTVILNPGRTFGALESYKVLRKNSDKNDVTIAETQTVLHTCRKIAPNSVIMLTCKNNVLLSTIDSARNHEIIGALPDCIRTHFVPASNTLETSLGNVGMILHCAPVLFNVGWIETKTTQFKYYYEGITPSVASFLESLDLERLEVAKRLGANVPSVREWMKRAYGIEGTNLYQCIQANPSYAEIDAPNSLQHRYLYEDIPTGLVPLEAIGKVLEIPMSLTTLVIDLGNKMVREDFRKNGRNARALGLRGKMNSEDVIEAIS